MGAKFQIVIDVHDAVLESKFWAAALGYVLEPPPAGFATWGAFYKHIGLPPEDCFEEPDSIVDPAGAGPRIWFHTLPEKKTCKNRLHFDIRASGERGAPMSERRRLVEAEVERLVSLGATRVETLEQPGVDHYAVGMEDPEGNEFDVN